MACIKGFLSNFILKVYLTISKKYASYVMNL